MGIAQGEADRGVVGHPRVLWMFAARPGVYSLAFPPETRMRTPLGFGLALFLFLSPAWAAAGWHKSRDDGLEAAKQSGKPLLVVTAWKEKV